VVLVRGVHEFAQNAAPPGDLPARVVNAQQHGQRVALQNGFYQTDTQLTPQDPARPGARDCRFRVYLVELQAGKRYVVEQRSHEIDPFLEIEDRAGVLMAQDDDGGLELDARIEFSPPRTETYVVIASSFDPDFGPFSLTIREVQGAGGPVGGQR
jgi:hypothetical protein